MEGVDVTEPTPEAAATEQKRRGRPRPTSTIERDEKVLESINGSVTRKQLAEATGLAESQVYLSLFRLRSTGKVQHARQGGDHVWSRVAEPETQAA